MSEILCIYNHNKECIVNKCDECKNHPMYQQGIADERERIVKELEELETVLVEYCPSGYDDYICKDDVLRIVRGGENE